MLQLYHMDFLRTIQNKWSDSRATTDVAQYILFFLIALIPFSIRHVFSSTWNFETGAYSDFTSLSIYMSDVVLITLVGLFLFSKRFVASPVQRIWIYFAGAAIIWLLLELFLQSRTTLPLQLYFTVRLILLIGMAFAISQIKVSREKIAWLFVILGVIQSFIALGQWMTQKSLGLYLLGESHLSPETLGVAKIVSHGTKLIRGYGTFPHPNLLSAFLLTTLLANIYLLIKSYQIPRGRKVLISLYGALLLNTIGLFLTFSRGGIIAYGITVLGLMAYFLINKRKGLMFHVGLPVIVALAISMTILAPYVSTRTTVSDNSTKERLFYNHLGEKMIKNQPLFGLGAGTSVLHMEQFAESSLEPWEVQPIHNFYLISLAESGVGAIFLLILILYPISALIKPKIGEWELILALAGVAFLVLFLFDHYFYTIWPTQLLLWIFIGLILNNFTWNSLKAPIYDKPSD
jgi:hypothetical protein